MEIGDSITYAFRSTGAFIPYADQILLLEIQDLSDPDEILIDVLFGDEDITKATILNETVVAGWYILNNFSLQSDWQTCPLQNITESKICYYWDILNLRNVSESYHDVERDALELHYSYNSEFHGDNYSISVRYVWDYSTGVMLNNSIIFTNEFDFNLSGIYEQYLVNTTIWKLSSTIPGFPLVWVLIFTGFAVIVAFFQVRKKTSSYQPTHPMSRSTKFILIITIFLSSSFLFIPSITLNATAASNRIMPGANVLLLTNNTESKVAVSLGLDNTIKCTQYIEGTNSTNDLMILNYSNYDCIIADGYLPDDENDTALHKIKSNINGTEANIGMIFFGGNYAEDALLVFDSVLPVEFVINRVSLNSTIVGFFIEQSGLPIFATSEFYLRLFEQTNTYEIKTNDIQVSVSDEQDVLPESVQSMYITRIAWESTPLLYERLLTYAKKPTAITLIEVPDTKEPLIVTWEHDWDGDNESAQVIYVSPGVATHWDPKNGENNEWNTPFRLWPYFNYFLYMMVYDIKGLEPEEIESYADWPWSPIPHQREAIIWMIFVGSLWVFNFTLFFILRRKSKKRDPAKSENSLNFKELKQEDTKEKEDKKQ